MKYLKAYNTETDKLNDTSKILPYMITVRNPLDIHFMRHYISNGLVFHLDGIEKGPTENSWTDLIGGKVFTNYGGVSLQNGWQFTNDLSSTHNNMRNTSTLSFSETTHTIEVCYYAPANKYGLIFLNKASGGICFGIQSAMNNIIWSSNSKPMWTKSSGNFTGYNTISVNTSRGIANINTTLTAGSNNSWSKGDYNGIGGRSYSYTYEFTGTIYAIRIYNRLLSEAEMKHNQMIDNKRFNLGL